MEQWGELEFHEAFCDAVARRARIGDALAEGTLEARSLKKAADTLAGRHRFVNDA
jgi:aldehyde:ferredoxin oxidoreductase